MRSNRNKGKSAWVMVIGVLLVWLVTSNPQSGRVQESTAGAADAGMKAVSTDVETSETAEGMVEDSETSLESNSKSGSETSTEPRLTIRFIDVGQGDSALITCEGHSMLIDGGTSANSSRMYAILKREGLSQLDFIVCTHPHADHAGGLAGALQYATAVKALAPVQTADNEAFQDFEVALQRQGNHITVPAVGDRFSLGSAEFEVLGPIRASTNVNDTSLVLRLTYGDTAILFMGDAERTEEQDLLESGAALGCDVLKVGHHGSDTSSTAELLKQVSPEHAVISLASDNDYGYPSGEVVERLEAVDAQIWRTDLQGDILCLSDGRTVTVTADSYEGADVTASRVDAAISSAGEVASAAGGAAIDAGAAGRTTGTTATTGSIITDPTVAYMANTSTGKFHEPGCASVDDMKESNKLYFTGTRDELIADGYVPCKRCNP